MIPAAAILAEATQRGYSRTDTEAVLTLALDENWVAIPVGFFNQLDTIRARGGSAPDAWYQIAQSRGLPATKWQQFKDRLYVHVDQAAAIYDGKEPMSKDDYARAIIAEGQRRGITARGIKIALATVFVESNFVMYANSKVPESLSLPHEAVGSDGMSVGLFQQQVRQGTNGQWWWGDAATCMDPTKSAGLFYDRLARIDYNGPNSPGSYAQAIQQSAFPDRYDQRMADASTLYDRLATGAPAVTDPNRPDFNEFPFFLTGNSNARDVADVDLWLLHTQEPPRGSDNRNDAALELRNFLESTKDGANPVSYHYAGSMANDGGTTIVDCVDTDAACWAVGNSNGRSINFCFAGSRSDWTRKEWLDNEHGTIEAAAYLFVQDCAKYPKLKARVIAPNYSDPPGAADHNYCTAYLKDGNNHTDVGPNFPWDVFTAAVNKYASGAPAPGGQPVPAKPVNLEQEIWDQLRLHWNQLGGKTLVEAVAQIRDKVCGTSDAGKPGVK